MDEPKFLAYVAGLEREARTRVLPSLEKAAAKIAPQLGAIDGKALAHDLMNVWLEFHIARDEEGEREPGSEARINLLALARAAQELRSSFIALGPVAAQLLTVVGEAYSLDGMEPGMLPDPKVESEPCGWINQLSSLKWSATEAARVIHETIKKGGRKTIYARVHGTPEENLAQKCQEIAQTHGCKSQAVALRMVQAILEAEHGKAGMKKMNGKTSEHKGRKAVRKVAQTKPKTGTV